MDAHSVNFPDDPDPLARYRREFEQDQERIARERRAAERADRAAAATTANNFWNEIDQRIEHSRVVLEEAVGGVIASERREFHEALRRRDDRIKDLKREVATLRTQVEVELRLASQLAAAKAEIAELRQRAPDLRSEMADLRATAERQQKLITRLRAEASQLNFGLRQMETARQKDRYAATLTSVEITNIGGATREVLERLRAEGVSFEDWSPLPSRLAS